MDMDTLFRTHQPALLTYLTSRLPTEDWDLVEDLAQDCWLDLLDRGGDADIETESGLPAALATAARTHLRRHLHPNPDQPDGPPTAAQHPAGDITTLIPQPRQHPRNGHVQRPLIATTLTSGLMWSGHVDISNARTCADIRTAVANAARTTPEHLGPLVYRSTH